MLEISVIETLVAATLVLLLGRKIVERTSLLRAYSIPEPVAGGLLVALLLLGLHSLGHIDVHFDTGLQAPLMLAFFATIGLNADLGSLRNGGKKLGIFLAVVMGLLVLQNAIGLGLAALLGLDLRVGLLAGSIALSGGHGTGAAWAKVFSENSANGLPAATEIAIACATFGLVLGGLVGGPVARMLIKRVTLPEALAEPEVEPTGFEKPNVMRLITPQAFIETLTLIAVCLAVGTALAERVSGTAFELPVFVWALFTGVLLRNGLALIFGYHVFERSISVMGNVSLSLFLAQALMSLRLWDLASLAGPVLIILAVQAIAMACYAVFVTFRVMGSNYDAAVLAAGHCGFGLGATPTAIANMQAVTDRSGPSPLAFLIVPMVSAFFIDIANAIVIKLYLTLPLFS
ncbi:MAG TPA: sodium/glutamate symporter [Herbaspirillum sp.]|nr:sodium/glutamate symporter [Herbaspirillum sp.]